MIPDSGLMEQWHQKNVHNYLPPPPPHLSSFPLDCTGLAWDGAGVRALSSHQCDLGSIPGLDVIYGLSLFLVLVLALKRFFSRYSGFRLFSKAMFAQLVLLEIYGNSEEKVCFDTGLKELAIKHC